MMLSSLSFRSPVLPEHCEGRTLDFMMKQYVFWPQLHMFIYKVYVLWRYISCREMRGCDENRFTLPEILAHSVYLAHLLNVLTKWRSTTDSLKPPLWCRWITHNHTAERTEICGKPHLEPSLVHLLHTGSRDVFKCRSIRFAWAMP